MLLGYHKENIDPNGSPIPCKTEEEEKELWNSGFWKNRFMIKSDFLYSHISTVFLSLNHGFKDGDEKFYETLVFGGPLDQDMWRCKTRAEARYQHEMAIRKVKLSYLTPYGIWFIIKQIYQYFKGLK